MDEMPYSCFECPYYNPGFYLGPGVNRVGTCIHKDGEGPIPSDMDTETPDWCPLRHGSSDDEGPELDKFSGVLGDAVRSVMRARN